jgi:integral membrane protein
MSPHVLFRRLARSEAVTWALLLLGMLVKYGPAWTDLGVRVFGLVHGVVFLAYCVVAVFVATNQRWRVGTTLLALASAVPPFATVWFERRAVRRGRLAGEWRLLPGGDRPGSPPERVQAWMLRRPALAVVTGVVVVGLLTGVALVAGPPVPPPGQ